MTAHAHGGRRPGAGRKPRTATITDGAPAAPARARPSLRDALARITPAPAPANDAAAAPATAATTAAPAAVPVHPLFANGWQQFAAERGTTFYVAWAEDYIRDKKRKEGGLVDQDEVDMMALSLAQGLREQFPAWSPPWWAVALGCAGGIYFTLDKTGKPIADAEIRADADKSQGEAPETKPEAPAAADETPEPKAVPRSWARYADRHPPAAKQSNP